MNLADYEVKRDRRKATEKTYHLRYNRAVKYGLTPEAVDALWEAQGRGCAVCKAPCLGERAPHIDHCHTTGMVRGILCHACNISLGMLRESPKRIRALADYAEKWVNVPDLA